MVKRINNLLGNWWWWNNLRKGFDHR